MLEDPKKGVRLKGPKESSHGGKPSKGGGGHPLVPVSEILPAQLPLVPVSHTTLFPGMMVPLILPEGKLTKTIDFVNEGTGYIGVVLLQKSASAVATGPSTSVTGLPADGTVVEENQKDGTLFHRFGVAAKVMKKMNLPDNQMSVLLGGLQRFEIKSLISEEPHYVANVEYRYEELTRDTELEALLRSALSQFKQLSKDNPLISEEVKVALVNIDGPGKLADFMASVLIRDVKDYQDFLQTAEVKERLRKLLLLLKKEQDVQNVQKKINEGISQKVTQAQRDYYLQEQLKLIQKELGRETEKSKLPLKFKERLQGKTLSEEAKSRIDDEFEKLESLSEQSSEYSVAINYLDWATSLPWGVKTEENLSLKHAQLVLDKDHYGLKDVKQRILEQLAVRKLKKSSEGTVLCLVGPPGTGKTSLGRSIARALERKFIRFSVGGMRDEAEIKGHRRTYVGAMPGKMIQGLKRAGSQNPVFLIDEIDKIGTFSHSGDPASALLELLDREQNKEFLDHYLDMPFDCSNVFFITTANSIDTIPPALLDRMEVIQLHGYTDIEKLNIAKNYLIPKQLRKNGLKLSQLRFSDKTVKEIIQRYAREAGVRGLEKQIAKLCRKSAYKFATGRLKGKKVLTPKDLGKFLGIPPFLPEQRIETGRPGVATGLAWTQYGGDILHIECQRTDGKGGLVLTGSLGDVMKESANIAYTFTRALVRTKDSKISLPKNYFEQTLHHLHVPAGATPKDGPSAGVTMAAALYSLLSQKPIRPDVAMTGELSLTGRVLPVGGIQEKLLAAKRSGLKRVILPKFNEKDLKEIDSKIKKGLEIIKVSHMDECLKHLF